jgi:hypothetical protein
MVKIEGKNVMTHEQYDHQPQNSPEIQSEAPTLRNLIDDLGNGEKNLEQVIEAIRNGSWPKPRPRATTLLESYQRAEEVPTDNDTFWFDVAFDMHLIDHPEYEQLFEALSNTWDEDPQV